ncbi:MAG: toll/interleukin-1 receptor domain-containing protein [Pseudomonadota bacterium]
MRVYLIAAPEDQEEAEKLGEYLKRFGVFIRTEFGQMAYPPAQHGEFTLALWSRNAMMSSRQMMLTNRAIDAWEEGRLVMARMDPGLSPRGLADLDMVDLTFAAAREHRYHDVLNAIRGMEDQRRSALQAAEVERVQQELHDTSDREMLSKRSATAMAPPPSSESVSGAAEAPMPTRRQASHPESSSTTGLARESAAAQSKGFPFLTLVVVLMLAGLAGFAYMSGWFGFGGAFDATDPVAQPPEPVIVDAQDRVRGETPQLAMMSNLMVWGAAIGGVILLGLVALILRRPKSTKKASQAPVTEETAEEVIDLQPEAEPTPSPEPAAPKPVPSVEPEGHDAFVSYSHANAETVLPIIESIEETGLSVWIDRDEMRAGQNWAGQIVRAIKASDRFCLMCSSQAFESDHVRREVYLADKYGKTMVPIRLDEAPMPEDIEYFLIGRQWIDLFALDEEERLGAIQDVLNSSKA